MKSTAKFLKRIWDFIKTSIDQTASVIMCGGLSLMGSKRGIWIVRKLLGILFGCFLIWLATLSLLSALEENIGYWAVSGDASMAPAIEQNELCFYKTCKDNTNIDYGDIIITRVTGNKDVINGYNEFDYFSLEIFEKLDMSIAYKMERVLGLPGDTIRIKNGLVYVNGELLQEDYVFSNINDDATYDEFVLEDGCYFSLPDNRDLAEYDYVNHSKIIGIVLFR